MKRHRTISEDYRAYTLQVLCTRPSVT